MILLRHSFFFASFFFFASCQAGMKEELHKFFESCGSDSNSNSADIYQGQKAGYATGGGASVRNRVMNTHPVTINLPKFDAGCGGIDIYAGGFSFVDSQKLVENLKTIASNAAGFAFLLSLETVSPQTSNNIKQLQSWANMINSAGINSCEVASQLVGSVWPQKTMAKEQICRLTGVNGLGLSDYIQARHDCSTKKNTSDVKNQLVDSGILSEEYNIGWEAIRQDAEFATNKELAEIMMTLMGTFVTTSEADEAKGSFYPSKITDDSFLKILLEGGSTTLYKCEDAKQCLVVREEPTTISLTDSWIGKVKNLLTSMQEKIFLDEELSPEEIKFLTKSSLPLYRIVNVLSAHKKGYCPLDLLQVAEVVAMDMLSQYLRESIDKVREGCQRLRWSQLYAAEIDEYLVQLDRVEKKVNYYETRNMARKDKETQIMDKIDAFEKYLFSQFVLY